MCYYSLNLFIKFTIIWGYRCTDEAEAITACICLSASSKHICLFYVLMTDYLFFYKLL